MNKGTEELLTHPECDENLKKRSRNETAVAHNYDEVPELDKLGLVFLAERLVELLKPDCLCDSAQVPIVLHRSDTEYE